MGSVYDENTLLNLQWNSYSPCWHTALSSLRTTGQYCDLTLVVDDGHLNAHRIIVSSCSPLLARALSVCHHPHPALVLKGIKVAQMKSILDFMYMGETRVDQASLDSLLHIADELSVLGLTGSSEECENISEKQNTGEVSFAGSPIKRPNSVTELSSVINVNQLTPEKPKNKKRKVEVLKESNSSPDEECNVEEKVKIPVESLSSKSPIRSKSANCGSPTSLNSDVNHDGDRTILTNLPEDRVKLRDIWDTFVAPDDVDGETIYNCLCCEKTFKGKSAKSNAFSHIDHNHTAYIDHKCHFCSQIFKSNDSLSRHISRAHKKVHNGDNVIVKSGDDPIVLD